MASFLIKIMAVRIDVLRIRLLKSSGYEIKRGYKTSVTKWARQNSDIYMVWQRKYHDRIIRHNVELNQVRKYIVENPRDWTEDENNQINIKKY